MPSVPPFEGFISWICLTTKPGEQRSAVLYSHLTRLHLHSLTIPSLYIRVSVIPCSCATTTQYSTSDPPFQKWLFVNKLQGSLILEMLSERTGWPVWVVKWITRLSTIQKRLSISLKSEGHMLPTPEPRHCTPAQESRCWGEWKESLRRNSGLSVLWSHSQIGVPELRTQCFDPWALLSDLHPLRLWTVGPRVPVHARSLRRVTQ